MEYFKSSLKSVLGTAPAGTQPTGADTVSGDLIPILYFPYARLFSHVLWKNVIFL